MEPDSLVAASSHMEGHAEEFLAAVERLRGRGLAWADDGLIEGFVEACDQGIRDWVEVLAAQGGALRATGMGLCVTAATARGGDKAAADAVAGGTGDTT